MAKSIGNPADLLPKKKVQARDASTDALGDLGTVIMRENQEAEKIARAMMEDMKKAKAMGLEPQFRTDELATEGMQPIDFPKDMKTKDGVDSSIPANSPIEAKPSEALDIRTIQSLNNYITPPAYFNDRGQQVDVGMIGPRSLLIDNGTISPEVAKEIIEENKAQHQVEKDTIECDIDPDDFRSLLGDDFIES